MKGVLFIFLTILTLSHAKGQDSLFLQNQSIKLVKILDVTALDIGYRLSDYADGPIFRVNKSEIIKIKYGNGLVEIFHPTAKPSDQTPEKEPKSDDPMERVTHLGVKVKDAGFLDGEKDARTYFRGYTSAATSSFCAGMGLIYGLPVPVATSLTPPATARLFVPDADLYQRNAAYAQGFNKKSHQIKINKVWSNYGYGAATSIGVTLGLFLIFITSIYP